MALAPQAQETFTRLFGAPAQPHPTDPELYEILQNQIFGEVFSTGVLTDVEREIITVTVLGCLQTLPQLRAHAAAALNVGATPLQLREALYQCAPYIGYPRALNAVAALDEVLTEQASSCPCPTPPPSRPTTPRRATQPAPPSRSPSTAPRSRRSSPPCRPPSTPPPPSS
ncbi:hypothetical protein ADENT20671_1256 [Actinomyces denticolens]|uniref:carboxymuconolactone decarboxylase family protein n=1 Tax=Actinomyces denticolens TaxID=52767 RepID=UPI0009D14AB8|nr:carboxymuconolactone decarboxylase family protein [Actinomyces denticolens]GAV94487.1 hypothetical protein ADENT20671_1256 [Actinomyces denticolens]